MTCMSLLSSILFFLNWCHLLPSASILRFSKTTLQREAVEALIQELPKFRLKAVPTDCSECPICLEEFHVGNEVREFDSALKLLSKLHRLHNYDHLSFPPIYFSKRKRHFSTLPYLQTTEACLISLDHCSEKKVSYWYNRLLYSI